MSEANWRRCYELITRAVPECGWFCARPPDRPLRLAAAALYREGPSGWKSRLSLNAFVNRIVAWVDGRCTRDDILTGPCSRAHGRPSAGWMLLDNDAAWALARALENRVCGEKRRRPVLEDVLLGGASLAANYRPPVPREALALARRAYRRRDFAHLPVLGDMLEDAGCVEAELLDHLRGGGPHYQGCWALDLVLGQ